MIGDAPDEYELVDSDEPESGSESVPARAPNPRPPLPGAPGSPLPRMWKSEDEDPAPTPPRAAAPKPDRAAKEPPPTPRRSTGDAGSTRKTGLKPPPGEDGEKKVLIEETPVLDTYETRQRVRLGTGLMLVFILGLGVHLVYSNFMYDPFPMGPLPPDDSYVVEPAPTAPRIDAEGEAAAMFARAREAAVGGRTPQAVALLGQIAKTYGKTRSGVAAAEALERSSRGLPPFSTEPTVAVTATAPAPTPPSAPTPTPTEPPAVAVAPAAPEPKPAEPPVRRLPTGFVAATDAGVDPSGWPLAIVGERDGARMAFIPGDVFAMGDDRDSTASPAHKVRLSAFYVDRHEVTVGQFRKFLAASRYRGRSTSTWPHLDEKAATPDDRPMTRVNLTDARAFADWAGKSLPTEAQWEAAARTPDGRAHPWGDDPPKYASERPLRRADAVMSFPEDQSPRGVFDLAGNVLEWTADAWDRNYYRSLADGIHDDPAGPPARGRFDVVVKGSKGNGAGREPIDPNKRLDYVGFRCVLQVERPAASVAPAAVPAVPTAPARDQPAANPSVVPF